MSADSVPWKRRMAQLAKGLGKPHPPLFAPLAHSIAGQIEAVSPAEFAADPTRITKGLVELSRAAGLSALVTAVPSGMEAEALGAVVAAEPWPAKVSAPAGESALEAEEFENIWAASPRLEAALEATRRLASTEGEERVLLAALSGPATFLNDLLGPERAPDADAFDFAGRALSALARAFGEAGATALVLLESGPQPEEWRGAVGPVANVSKFHRMPLFIVQAGPGEPIAMPHGVACLPMGAEAPGGKAHGRVLPAEPAAWAGAPQAVAGARFATTMGEIDPALPLGAFLDAAEAARTMETETAP